MMLRLVLSFLFLFFFFQAEDGIRDKLVTGVQTCALPISDHTLCGQSALLLRRLGVESRRPISWTERRELHARRPSLFPFCLPPIPEALSSLDGRTPQASHAGPQRLPCPARMPSPFQQVQSC